jgi:hypothetical protein
MPLVGGRSGYVSAEPVAARFASLINTLDGIARQVLHQVPPEFDGPDFRVHSQACEFPMTRRSLIRGFCCLRV